MRLILKCIMKFDAADGWIKAPDDKITTKKKREHRGVLTFFRIRIT